jgi:uncharacterized protein (TIGR02391 family)
MTSLQTLVPDVDVLLALQPEELAPLLLRIAKTNLQNDIFAPGNLSTVTSGSGMPGYQTISYAKRANEIELAIAEGWNWLRVQGFIVPAPGTNGVHGFMQISRRGKSIQTDEDFENYRQAAAFSRSLLHPSIENKVWLALARGDRDEAVFAAFKAVEEAVRKAGGFGPTDIGVELMRKAFDPAKGRLTDTTKPKPEREALAHLFAGAIGSYKNPHSHRTVSITDPKEAQEMVILASHLLRIIDDRAPPPANP